MSFHLGKALWCHVVTFDIILLQIIFSLSQYTSSDVSEHAQILPPHLPSSSSKNVGKGISFVYVQ